ncbi:histone-binding protein N1/N2-like isoform X4 [Hippocampus comes]|uniref:histone-binding protein N1/N2-like isoform X3 n=1 Tax=Hippocampus comes TaxID=109280 RepID=UPI00094EBAA5|nr:PREDICTED: histone-binding protein N1/N2-like isoform X3 [Hippocampus comes]XP_019734451.1 PREDICTED: histone-binding protein N1/N2-like isoform X4 [Hippocampus comes]
MEEANKLVGAGKNQLVMGKVVEAVSTLQEACGILAKAYGDTADECAEAFFWCGRALLDLARMENSVLGNALEGVPEGDEDEKPQESNVEGTENVDEKTRDELRVQVYDAMAEKPEDAKKKAEGDKKLEESDADKADLLREAVDKTEELADKEGATAADRNVEECADKMEDSVAQEPTSPKIEEQETDKKEEDPTDEKVDKMEKNVKDSTDKGDELSEKTEDSAADKNADASDKMEAGEGDKMADKKVDEPVEKMEEEPAKRDDGDEDEEEDEDNDTREKESNEEEEEEVGNLQLAWEMLEVAKVIYKRKEPKEDQLMAAQAHLRLGEVSVESGNYTQALEDFQECLSLQLKHLDADSRLLAETHYQLGLTFTLNQQYKEAIDELNRSVSVIKSRLENLTELIAKAAGPEALSEERQEMEELKALLPDIQEKVEDATAMKAVLDGASTSSAAQSGDTSATSDLTSTTTFSSAIGSAASAPVSDISHLVRKKRKPEESPEKEGIVKKAKQDDAQETCAVQKANGDTNGAR